MQIKKILDVGTSHPLVARVQVGMFEIIDFAQISKDDKERIQLICFEIVKSLVQAEKAALPLINEIKVIEEQIAKNGIKTQAQGRVIETPCCALLEDSRTFFKFIKQALQHLASAMGILLDKEFKGPHFHKILEQAKVKLGDDHVVTKLLEEDQEWLKEINDIRNEDEHPKSGKDFVRNFNITQMKEGGFLVDVPRFFNDSPVLNRLEIFSHNILTFTEEMLAHTLESKFPPIVKVYDIPEEQRDPKCPKRFRIGLDTKVQFGKK